MTSSTGVDLSSSPTEELSSAYAGEDVPPEVAAEATMQRRRRLGWIVVLAVGLAMPILLLVAGYAALVWSGDRQAEQAIERARAAGDPVTLADMEAHYPTSPAIEEATGHWLRAIQVVRDPGFLPESNHLPVFDPSKPRILDELSQKERLAVDEFLTHYRGAIEEAHAARRAGAVARFPVDFGAGYAMDLQYVQDLRSLAPLLELDLEAKLAAGDVDGAVENLLSMIAANESLQNEPILVSQLVRIAILGLAVEALQRTLARRDLTDEQLARIQEALARQRFDASLRASLQGEQYFLIHTMQSNLSGLDVELGWAGAAPLRGGDLAKALEFWRPVIDASDEGMLETLQANRAMEAQVEEAATSGIDRLRYPLTLMLLPAIDRATNAFLRGEGLSRTATVGVACERYRLTNGAFPDDLGDLVPDYLPQVPRDPFDEQPLRYSASSAGVLIYSVDEDLVDDGGMGDLTFGLLPDDFDKTADDPSPEAP